MGVLRLIALPPSFIGFETRFQTLRLPTSMLTNFLVNQSFGQLTKQVYNKLITFVKGNESVYVNSILISQIRLIKPRYMRVVLRKPQQKAPSKIDGAFLV